jgi:hypothetical protein
MLWPHQTHSKFVEILRVILSSVPEDVSSLERVSRLRSFDFPEREAEGDSIGGLDVGSLSDPDERGAGHVEGLDIEES